MARATGVIRVSRRGPHGAGVAMTIGIRARAPIVVLRRSSALSRKRSEYQLGGPLGIRVTRGIGSLGHDVAFVARNRGVCRRRAKVDLMSADARVRRIGRAEEVL